MGEFLYFYQNINFLVGSKNKLKRFKENEQFENVIQPERQELQGGNFDFRGDWSGKFF